MTIPTLREEVRELFINDTLRQLPAQKNITLWQNIHGKKIMMPVKIASIKEKQGVIRFFSKKENASFRFSSKDPIYFYESKKTFIFKSTISFQSAMELDVRLPTFIMLEELREEIRRSGILEQLFVQFRCNHQNHNGIFEKKVLDYGSGGFSVLVRPGEAKHLYPGDSVHILSSSNEVGVNMQRIAKIIHANKYFDGKQFQNNLIKIGMCFTH